MNRILAAFSIAVMPLIVFAQQAMNPGAQPDASKDANVLIAKLDALNHILPLLLTKAQSNKILTAMEKAREKDRQVLKMEAEKLKPLIERMEKAVKRGEEERLIPERELLAEVAKMLRSFDNVRTVTTNQNVDALEETLKSTLNSGQMKALTQSLDPRFFAPDIKIEEVSDSQRTRLFIRAILLQPAAYDVLVALSKQP